MANTNTYIIHLRANEYLEALKKEDLTEARKGKQYVIAENLYKESRYNTKTRKWEKNLFKSIYDSTLTDSMDLKYLNSNSETKKYFKTDPKTDRLYTDAIIDVSFNNNFSHTEIVNSKKKIKKYNNKKMHEDLYKNGINLIVNGEEYHYCFYTRSANKVKQGHCLFINSKIFGILDDWASMACREDKIAAWDKNKIEPVTYEAYRSLTTSSIIDDLKINMDQILLIDDMQTHFYKMANITYQEKDGSVKSRTEEIEQTSDIFDGQSLIDISIIPDQYKEKGFLLLRNKFFKSAAFSCNIQKFFLDEKIKKVKDMFGNNHNASDIMIITTPNSLKFLKFSNCFNNSKEAAYNHWNKNRCKAFGIVKYEKNTHIKSYDNQEIIRNQLSYQMLNSLPISREDARSILKYDIWVINQMKQSPEFVKDKFLTDSNRMKEFNCISLKQMLEINPDIAYTTYYKEARNHIIEGFQKKLFKGHIDVEGDNCTVCSNPIEMLKAAAGIKITDDDIVLNEYEVYTPLFENGKKIAGFRSPHNTPGSVCYLTNTKNATLDKYMNLTKNIVVVRSYKSDILARCAGMDMDSDFLFLTSNDVIVQAAKKCSEKYLTPYNNISGVKKTYRKDRASYLAEADTKLSHNLVGQISNLGQLLLSYFWDYGDSITEEDRQKIYNYTCICENMAQLEIDKAKKSFKKLNWGKTKDEIYNAVLSNGEPIIKTKTFVEIETGEIYNKFVAPKFFETFSKDSRLECTQFNCPMDYVKGLLSVPSKSEADYTNNIKVVRANIINKNIMDIIVKQPLKYSNSRQIFKIVELATEIQDLSNSVHSQKENDEEIKNKIKIQYDIDIDEKIEKLKKIKLSESTVYDIFKRLYKPSKKLDTETQKNLKEKSKIIINLLVNGHPDIVKKCFYNSKKNT